MEILLVAVAVAALVLIVIWFSRRDQSAPPISPQLDIKPRIPVPLTTTRLSTALEVPRLPRQFVVLDLETTGLSPRTNEIIEIGAIRVDLDSDVHLTFQTLVRPQKRVPHRISQMTGISQEMVEHDGRHISDALGEFLDFIQELPLVTFNANFDMAFLHAAAAASGRTITNPYTCALKLARRAWPGLASYRLVDLARLGGLSNDGTHRALGDCQRAMIVFTAAASEVRGKVKWTTPDRS